MKKISYHLTFLDIGKNIIYVQKKAITKIIPKILMGVQNSPIYYKILQKTHFWTFWSRETKVKKVKEKVKFRILIKIRNIIKVYQVDLWEQHTIILTILLGILTTACELYFVVFRFAQ